MRSMCPNLSYEPTEHHGEHMQKALLAAALVSAAALVVPGPASAVAVPRCAIGSWKLTAMKSTEVLNDHSDPTFSHVMTGFLGTRIKVTASRFTYDFKRSKPG